MTNQCELSVLVPANREMFLAKTIEDLLANIEADTEIIAVLDSAWDDPKIPQHERVNVIYTPTVVGQRAATNLAAKLARGKYVAKADAHCSFDKGFDRKMLEGFKVHGDDVTAVPIMRNLHAFDWKCYKCGSRWYQGPTPTRCMKMEGNHVVPNLECNETRKFRRKMTWKPRRGTYSQSYTFDAVPHFQYFHEYKSRPEYIEGKKTGFTETMSLQGSFFMCTRAKYWELNLSDESFGSWGNQGIEVACKTWLSGGMVLVNHNTWYAHMFRTQGGDFSFPYDQSGHGVEKTKKRTWDFIVKGKIAGQVHPVSWLLEKFWPVSGWSDAQLKQLKEKEHGNNKISS